MLKKFNPWSVHILWIVLIVGIPIFIIFSQLLKGPTDTWFHIYDNLLSDYIKHSVILVSGVSLLTCFLGISSAWVVSTCNLPHKRTLEWLLIMPLAIPTYINGFAYSGLLDYAGPVRTLLRGLRHDVFYFDIMNIWGVTFVMSAVLYPYVYVTARSAFSNQSGNLLEAARSLGSSSLRVFRTIALPIARPAIISGLLLVIMEVLNDYGTVKYYGVTTFTTGIFRSWLAMGDLQSAIYLSSMLMGVVFSFILLERVQRGDANYNSKTGRLMTPYEPKGLKKVLCYLACCFPIVIGFVVPVFQLLYWAFFTIDKIITPKFFTFASNSFSLSILAAVIIIAMGILLSYSTRIMKSKIWNGIAKISMLGYSVPGAVIAIGIMVLIIGIDKTLITFLRDTFSINVNLLITGSIGALIYAYTVRYYAVGYGPIESGFKKIPESLNDSARSLGVSHFRNLIKINLPLLRLPVLSALILVFVDVMKELPLTLILRPFNFDTLATIAFQYANDEMVPESAPASLVIILIGLIPIILLNRMMKSSSNG